MDSSSPQYRLQFYTFLGMLLALFILVALLFQYVINILLLSVILAIIFKPLNNYFLNKFKSSALAAALTLLVLLLGLVGFFGIFGQLLYQELLGLYNFLKAGNLLQNQESLLGRLPDGLKHYVTTVSVDINSLLAKATSNIFQTVSGLLSNLTSLLFNLFLLFFSFYYLLKDGGKLKNIILKISPISGRQENLLYEKVVRSVNGVMKGTFLVGLIQSCVAFVGFVSAGISNPLLWAMCTFIAAFVPNVGTAIVIAPAIGFLFFTGNTTGAIIMAVFGVLAGLVDNFVSPRLVGKSAKLHPLLVLLSVIGGLQFFGFLGFLLGPIVMAIFVAFLEMYLTDFNKFFGD